MLSGLFGKKKHKQIKASVSSMEFAGKLEGSGVDALRFEVGKCLKGFSFIENAYFSKLKYQEEETPRIALLIEMSEPSKTVGAAVADQCAGIVPMDIMFSDNCESTLLEKIKLNAEPLFSFSNMLFECPLVVTRGSNLDMPEEWKGAILNYYVSATDYESALLKAVNNLKSEGYQFQKVNDGKVNQLDPSVWWDQYVMEKWEQYSEYFPSQEDIEVILLVGGIHKGPALGWDNE